MAIDFIEEFRQKNGDGVLKVYIKPNNNYPDGTYFYASAEDIDVVYKCGWGRKSLSQDYIVGSVMNYYTNSHYYFHQELALKSLGHYIECVEHINGVQFDNYRGNISFEATPSDNARNVRGKGYSIDFSRDVPKYQISCRVGHKSIYGSVACNEYYACLYRRDLETKVFQYKYDFLKDRRDDFDILDLERTGQISEEEATYHHVIKYAKDNAWYYYRYGLQEYFKDNHIPVPDYKIDEYGLMRHPITNELLCPFGKDKVLSSIEAYEERCQKEDEEKLYSARDIANLLGVSFGAVYKWRKKGRIEPDLITTTGREFYSKEQVEKLVEMNGDSTDMLSSQQFADMLNVSCSCIYDWKEKGDITPNVVTLTGKDFYSKVQVEKFIKDYNERKSMWTASQIAKIFDVDRHKPYKWRNSKLITPDIITSDGRELYSDEQVNRVRDWYLLNIFDKPTPISIFNYKIKQ